MSFHCRRKKVLEVTNLCLFVKHDNHAPGFTGVTYVFRDCI